MNYRVFISYSSSEKPMVQGLHSLLKQTFDRAHFWLDERDITPGDEWLRDIEENIKNCKLMILVLTKDACLSPYVKKEVEIALKAGVRILPVKFDKKLSNRDIETALPGVEKVQSIIGGKLGGLDAVERIISGVKKEYEEHLTGEVRTFESVGDLISDVCLHKTDRIRVFMIDGGTTLRSLLSRDPVTRLIENSPGGRLLLQCLFVDTNIRDLVLKSPAGKGRLDPIIPEETYGNIFEGLLQASRWIHNAGPHDVDIEDNIQSLTEVRDRHAGRVIIEVRTVPVLPVNRLVLTDSHCYIPAFFPLQDGLNVRKTSYYALRFSGQTHINQVASDYYDHYWKMGRVLMSESKSSS